MEVDVEVEALIPFPPEEVSTFAGDPNAPLWYANITSVSRRTPPPVAVGSQMDFEARFLGRRLSYTYEVVDLKPGQRLVMRTADGSFPMETTYTWTPMTDRTLMTLRNHGVPNGFAKAAAPVMARAMQGAMTKDLARLSHHLANR